MTSSHNFFTRIYFCDSHIDYDDDVNKTKERQRKKQTPKKEQGTGNLM